MKDKRDIEKAARSLVEPYHMEPPAQAWDSLDAELSKKQAVRLSRKTKRLTRLSAVLVLLLIPFVAYYFMTPPGQQEHIADAAGKPSGAIAPAYEAANPPLHPGNDGTPAAVPGTQESPAPMEKRIALEPAAVLSIPPAQHEITDDHAEPGDKPTAIRGDQYATAETGPHAEEKSGRDDGVPVQPLDPIDTYALAGVPIAAPVKFLTKPAGTASAMAPAETAAESVFSLSASFSPEYAWSKMKDNTPDPIDDVAMYESREHSEFSFSAGIGIVVRIKGRWSVLSGLRFASVARSMTLPAMYAQWNPGHEMHFMLPSSNGMMEMPFDDSFPAMQAGDSINVQSQCRQILKSVNVPLLVRFGTRHGKVSWYVNGGIFVRFMTQKKASVKMDNGETATVHEIHGLNNTHYGYQAGAGMQYDLVRSLAVFAEPVYRGSFSSLTRNHSVKSYPHTIGIDTGMLFRF